jgi:hypothetical protein|tara:strand:+ start:676 stop:900 length:225 start_codon:yes stop_codon:yes gene_type:complete
MDESVKTLLKQIFSALQDIKDTAVANNQLIGFLIQKDVKESDIPKEYSKALVVSNEQLDYMMENNISLTQWGDC